LAKTFLHTKEIREQTHALKWTLFIFIRIINYRFQRKPGIQINYM